MSNFSLLPEGKQVGNIFNTETIPVIEYYPYINLLNEQPNIATKKETKNVTFNERIEIKKTNENITENIIEETVNTIPNSNIPNSNIPNSNVQPSNTPNINTPNNNGPDTIEGYGNISGGLNYSEYGR
jgi:hypothetical protein